ncbi:MAG: hypothetical protein WA231_21525 [Methylocella sp.]
MSRAAAREAINRHDAGEPVCEIDPLPFPRTLVSARPLRVIREVLEAALVAHRR